MMKELSVKVGDKLLYSKDYAYNRTEKVATVTKVTPTGRIRIDCSESQFDKYGCEMGNHDMWSSSGYLSEITPEDIKRIKENSAISKAVRIIRNLKQEDITYEKALKIIELFERSE